MRLLRLSFLFASLLFAGAELSGRARGDDASPSGDATIRAPFGKSEIVITTTARLAGAIHSLTWNGQEFIDSADHGRQLQSACSYDNTVERNAETFNPTEAGSRDDGAGSKSTSQLLELSAEKNVLRTRTRMAFWLQTGERSGGQLARNTELLSRHELSKEVRIGGFGLPNVLDYTVTLHVPEGEPHQTAQIEALTGYMPPEFSSFWRFDGATGKLAPVSDGPGEINDPIVLATPDGQYAMGILSLDPAPPHGTGPTYGRFRFVPEKVVKWNCVFRLRDGVAAGDHSFHMAVPLGTRDDVEQALRQLSNRH
jgi:hypothetical protein